MENKTKTAEEILEIVKGFPGTPYGLFDQLGLGHSGEDFKGLLPLGSDLVTDSEDTDNVDGINLENFRQRTKDSATAIKYVMNRAASTPSLELKVWHGQGYLNLLASTGDEQIYKALPIFIKKVIQTPEWSDPEEFLIKISYSVELGGYSPVSAFIDRFRDDAAVRKTIAEYFGDGLCTQAYSCYLNEVEGFALIWGTTAP
jgi:hypothetical protein